MTGDSLRNIFFQRYQAQLAAYGVMQQKSTLNKIEGRWRHHVSQRLDELVKLEEGWDGYKGFPVPFGNAYFTMSMLDSICGPDTPAPSIVPGSSGDLQVEWHTKQGDLELWVKSPYNVQVWLSTPNDPDGVEKELSTDFTEVVMWVKKVTEPELGFAEPAIA